LKTINAVILLSIFVSVPAYAEGAKRTQGGSPNSGAEHTPNPTMQADRQALQADREKMREDHQALKADREKMREDHQKLHEEREKKRDDRRAEHEKRVQQRQESRNASSQGELK
jgi:Skp family chaperone for outer membrane proteins